MMVSDNQDGPVHLVHVSSCLICFFTVVEYVEFGEIWVPPPKKDDTPEDPDGPPLRKLFVGNLPYRVSFYGCIHLFKIYLFLERCPVAYYFLTS